MTVTITTSEPAPPVLPGYAVLGTLSRGHRLDVIDAWSERRRCRCVIKIARPDRRDEPAVRAALLAEGDLLRRLDHPHWVRLYEVVEEPEPALVLEMMTGTTLAAMLDDHRRLRPGDVTLLGAQIASALAYLHAHGSLHLDLTPGNVVVTGGLARLFDLSIAGPPGHAPRGAGTRGYRAPEQRRGDLLTTATDVWGLGRLLHECLTGVEPEDDDQPVVLSARAGRRRLPPPLVDLVNACLSPAPADRPSVDDVLAALAA